MRVFTVCIIVLALTTFALAHIASNHPKSLSTLETLQSQIFDLAWVSQVMAFDDLLERGSQTVYGEVQRPVVRDAVWDVVVASREQSKLLEAWLKRSGIPRPDPARISLVNSDLQDTINQLTGRTVPNHDMNMSGDADRAFLRGAILADRYMLELAQIAVAEGSAKAEVRQLAKGFADGATQRIKRFTGLLEALR